MTHPSRRFVLVLALALTLIRPTPAVAAEGGASSPINVDLELILMADGSGSIDDREFVLQRGGYARALRHSSVADAIKNGMLGRVALSYVEWSGPFLHVPIVPWTEIKDETDLEAFATLLEQSPRALYGGGTAVGNAIAYGAESIRTNQFKGRREVIDISGDGPDRNGLPASIGRDLAVAQGLTVNGLPILQGNQGLDLFFRQNVIGGRGAFSIPAETFEDVYDAVRRKLVREIADAPAEDSPQAAETR